MGAVNIAATLVPGVAWRGAREQPRKVFNTSAAGKWAEDREDLSPSSAALYIHIGTIEARMQ